MAYGAFVASGVAATLIKNPVYMPVPVAVLLFVGWRRGARSWFRPGIAVYVLAVAGSVVGFKVYANAVNSVAGFLTHEEWSQYFGPFLDRLDPLSWRRILNVLGTQVLHPLAALIALWGAIDCGWKSKGTYRSLFLGLAVGAFLALLTFFNRYTWHNYYQLPLVFPMAFLAGYGVDGIYRLLVSWRGSPGRWSLAAESFAAVAIVVTVVHAGLRYPELTGTPTEWIRARGEWIQDHSRPGDFVVYLLDTRDPRDWNPVFLYFAKRDGYNLPARGVKPRVLGPLYGRYAPDYERFFIFCPADLYERVWRRLEALGATLTEAGPAGMLFRLDGPPHRGGEATPVESASRRR